jgi:hypothetical protein
VVTKAGLVVVPKSNKKYECSLSWLGEEKGKIHLGIDTNYIQV